MAKQNTILCQGIQTYKSLTFGEKSIENNKQSAISDHLITYDCNINFNDFTILSKDFSNFNLLTKES